MGKNAKIGIAGGVVLVLALLAMTQAGALLGLVVLVAGGLGVGVLYQRLPEDEGGGGEKGKGKQLKGKKALDALLDSREEGATKTKRRPSPSTPPAAPAGEGLPTWGGGLDTWTPPSGDDIEVVEETEPAADWDSWDNEWSDTADDTDTLEVEDPLGNLDRLDDIDPVAEVERIDALDEVGSSYDEDEFAIDSLDEFESDFGGEQESEPAPAASGGGFSFGSAPPVINEAVESADDIMAASQATELGDAAADSELAKLLAKVQARLAAYE